MISFVGQIMVDEPDAFVVDWVLPWQASTNQCGLVSNSGFETALQSAPFGAGVQNTSQITIFGAILKKPASTFPQRFVSNSFVFPGPTTAHDLRQRLAAFLRVRGG